MREANIILRGRGPGSWVVGVALTTAAMASARAEPPQRPPPIALELHDTSRADCPDASALERQVTRLLGHSPFDIHATRRLRIELRARRRGLRAQLRLTDRSGTTAAERRIDSAERDCGALMDAMALSIVLAVDPVRGLELMETVAAGGTPWTPPPEVGSAPAQPHTRWISQPARLRAGHLDLLAATRGAPWTLQGTVGTAVTAGKSPEFAVALHAGMRARRARWSYGVALRYQPASVLERAGGAIEVDFAGGAVDACRHLDPIAACGVVLVGRQRSSGDGFDRDRAIEAIYLAVGGRLAIDRAIGRVAFARVVAELVRPLSNLTLRVGGDRVWSNAPISGAIGVHVGARFF